MILIGGSGLVLMVSQDGCVSNNQAVILITLSPISTNRSWRTRVMIQFMLKSDVMLAKPDRATCIVYCTRVLTKACMF